MNSAIKKLLDQTSNYDDSIEVAAALSELEGYAAAEARTHICGLWAHAQRLHSALARECGNGTPPDRFLKLPEVKEKTTFSTSELYRRVAAGDFPQQVRLGPKSVAWVESEVNDWIDERIASR